jgi:TM2 domain-containing membrane protein YozV
MKGKVLEFQNESRAGTISGDDGQRYSFEIAQWKGASLPKAGSRVDFSASENVAEAIYTDSASLTGNSKKIPAGIFALFLGGFGAHKFYLGYTKQGLIMLLTFIFGWILLGIPSLIIGVIAFVEAIMYLTKSDDDFERIYVDASKPWF